MSKLGYVILVSPKMIPDAQIYAMSILPTPHGPKQNVWVKYRSLF